tara:strand:- start:316 stop:1317 length:1002 start_codon:yes stop_codon:yes gene_type:complete
MHQVKSPYLLFLGHTDNPLAIKTSRGIAQWCPDKCVGETHGNLSVGLQKMTPTEAVSAGAKTFVVGLANGGGRIAPEWVSSILEAIEAGMDIASGLHEKISDINVVRVAAQEKGVAIHDIRHLGKNPDIGNGEKRQGKRILTVGTDCSVGKMYTSLAIEREMKSRSFKVDFRATGQTGIFIAGSGVPVDAVVADFISGSVEALCHANDPDHWDVIEGQGSLFNPAFAGVSLGLLHGAQADVLVMCHEAGRKEMKDLPGYFIPSLEDCVDLNLNMARLTNPGARLGAISLNCRNIQAEEATERCQALAEKYSVPCFDPLIHGARSFVDTLEGDA